MPSAPGNRQAMPTMAIGGSDPVASGWRDSGWTDGAAEGGGGSIGWVIGWCSIGRTASGSESIQFGGGIAAGGVGTCPRRRLRPDAFIYVVMPSPLPEWCKRGSVPGAKPMTGTPSNACAATSPVRHCRTNASRSVTAGRSCIDSSPPFGDSTTHVVLELADFIAALVPRPRTHLTRYHGMFAPNFNHRHRTKSSGGLRARVTIRIRCERHRTLSVLPCSQR